MLVLPLAAFIGLRYSRAKQKNRFISFISLSSLLGIMLGVAVLIVGVSAMNGFERELRDRILSVIPHGELESAQGPFANWPALVKQVEQDRQVIAAAPYINVTGLLQKGNEMKGVALRAIEPELEDKVTQMSQFITGDGWQRLAEPGYQLILGKGIADKLGLQVNDNVTLLLPNLTADNKLSAPRRVTFTLVGLLEMGGQLDHSLGFIHLNTGNELTAGVNGVAFKTTDVMDAVSITRRVAYASGLLVYIKPWVFSQGNVYQDIQMVKALMYVILFLVVAVACFNIVSTLVMAVNDKKGDIAILQTMGASSALLRNIFIVQGLLNGVVGALFGVVLGVIVALNLTEIFQFFESLTGQKVLSGEIYFIDFMPSLVQPLDVVVIASVAVLMSLLATIYPAWRATKVKPAQQLGHG
ncbi:lipoprotein-releasing ABC transporter permease subunit LolE [Motilimonas cestriensis]|uniref:Lipoprotein-releasing ABC transporter permease subunit LolE n=1 Tax=Motilimonas cestriensis TaxID=2742685 RepID=A0ABS8W4S7_9GAMM|nr:lipoprotein-releasing ABC transporter permease subunit LolE [Motilimonas cestriensis]